MDGNKINIPVLPFEVRSMNYASFDEIIPSLIIHIFINKMQTVVKIFNKQIYGRQIFTVQYSYNSITLQ